MWAGIGCLALAALCLVLTVVGLMASFQAVAESDAPKPSDLARGISLAILPLIIGVPVGMTGIGLLISGAILRRRAKRPTRSKKPDPEQAE